MWGTGGGPFTRSDIVPVFPGLSGASARLELACTPASINGRSTPPFIGKGQFSNRFLKIIKMRKKNHFLGFLTVKINTSS